jgi:hypothetical protein
MNLPTRVLLALCLVALCAPGGASAQENKWDKPVDLKLLIPPVPPVLPIPRDFQLNPGTVGGTQTPYTPAPLQNPGASSAQPAPGIRLSIPTR